MNYEERKIVKKFQIAIRRLICNKGIENTHFIHKYINKEELISKFQNHFIDNMNWENYGETWEVCHIIPVIYFDHTKEDDLKLCWNIKNMTPLMKEDNKNFGSCLYFAKYWFKNNQVNNEYEQYINFIDNHMSKYYKYFNIKNNINSNILIE